MADYWYLLGSETTPYKILRSLEIVGGKHNDLKILFDNTSSIYFVDGSNNICEAPEGSTLYEIVKDCGKHAWLEADFKYNVGDKVVLRPNIDAILCEITRKESYRAKPRYYVKFLGNKNFSENFVHGPFEENEFIPYNDTNIKTWNDMVNNHIYIDGYFINDEGEAVHLDSIKASEDVLFATKRHVKSIIAQSRISYLLLTNTYGGPITESEWGNSNMLKYSIVRDMNKISIIQTWSRYNFLSFHDRDQAVKFLENNKELVYDYYMLEYNKEQA